MEENEKEGDKQETEGVHEQTEELRMWGWVRVPRRGSVCERDWGAVRASEKAGRGGEKNQERTYVWERKKCEGSGKGEDVLDSVRDKEKSIS